MINTWELWEKEWKNVYNFYNSKGNTETRSRLKDKWYKEFQAMLKLVEQEVLREKDVLLGNDKNERDLTSNCPSAKNQKRIK